MSESDRLSISDVAIVLRVRYQRARDLVLSGQLGEVEIEGNRYYVQKASVERYRKEEHR